MSAQDHAAVVREALELQTRYYESIGLPEVAKEENDALVALEALLADNEGLREALERISTSRRSGMTAHAHVAFLQQEARAALAPEQEQP